jgi:ATP-dependent DNA helicase RecQ
MLACGDDLVTLENFIFGDTPTPDAVKHLVDHTLRLGKEFDVSVHELSVVNDIRPLVVTTLLTYLELEGMIEATRPFYANYSVKLLRDFEKVLMGYDGRRKSFLRKVFAAAKEGRSWHNFAVDEVALATGEDRNRIVTALVYLEEAGDVILKKSGVRQGYRLLRDDVKPRDIAHRLEDRFRKREQADLKRLREVVELAETDQCLTGFVTEHFGERLGEPCGHCDRCRGVKPTSIPRSAIDEIDPERLEIIQALRAERHACLKGSRQLARFLCGISSPAVTRARLSRHDAFGLLENHPFEDVLTMVETFV